MTQDEANTIRKETAREIYLLIHSLSHNISKETLVYMDKIMDAISDKYLKSKE